MVKEEGSRIRISTVFWSIAIVPATISAFCCTCTGTTLVGINLLPARLEGLGILAGFVAGLSVAIFLAIGLIKVIKNSRKPRVKKPKL